MGQDSNVVAIYSSIAIYIPWLFSSMGSLGWTQCYWCDYWVNNPYILDWIRHALCDLCMDWHLGQNRFAAMAEAEVALGNEWSGLPYEPTHVTRCSRLILHWFPQLLVEQVTTNIASFLVDMNHDAMPAALGSTISYEMLI